MDVLRRFEEVGHNGHPLRPTTFWSWNDRLDPDEVRRQVREMAKAGLGGHFMHARRGLRTPYLSSAWLEAVRAAMEEGRRTDLAPWLYDEDCWPSGTCSGRVYDGHERYQAKYLVFEELGDEDWQPTERTVAVFLAKRNAKTRYRDFELLSDPREVFGTTQRDGEVFLHFAYRTDEYVDTLNRTATKEFIKQTHEWYKDTVGKEFGKLIPGIFTDEPMYGRGGHRVPWSQELPKFFQRSADYDLTPHLPELFLPVGNYRRTRFDFYESVTRLFLLAWTMPVHQWCDRHKLALTGHVMAEDTLLSQVRHVGAAMPHYEYMHLPGIDHLGRLLGSPVLPKQASSVAAQLERPRVLSEMFGCSGWNASFDDLRWIAEWQFVLGVNLVCQHLSSFTLRGARKRDYPPSLHLHQPWWPLYHLWNDYAARLLSALTAGTPHVDVLVVHPIASAWSEYSPLETAPVEALDASLVTLCNALLGMHADFHFGDELILERHARVEKGHLVVGACRYRTVVVPDATNLRKSTVDLLKRFLASDGRLVFAGRVPDLVDGEPADAPAALMKQASAKVNPATARGRSALKKQVEPPIDVRVGSKDADQVLVQWRRDGDDDLFFFLNTAEEAVEACIRLPVTGQLVRMDAATGRTWAMDGSTRQGRLGFTHAFAPRDSLLVLVRPETKPVDLWAAPASPPKRSCVLDGQWHVVRRDPNALTLDRAAWRGDEGEYGRPAYILDVQHELMRRGTDELVYLKFEFDCALRGVKGRRVEVVLEQPEACQMWYCGMRTPLRDAGAYWDAAFRRVDVGPYLRPGRNVIEIRRPWHVSPRQRDVFLGLAQGWDARTKTPETELEAIYLIGDFGVAFTGKPEPDSLATHWLTGTPRLVDEPESTRGQNLTLEGYPFYAGRMTFMKEITLKRRPSPDAVLQLPRFHAVTATVEVNGQEAGTAWKPPRTVPVGDLLVEGANRVEITLCGSLRNLLGPHHHADGEVILASPASFNGASGGSGRADAPNPRFRPEYNVVAFGLGGEVVLRY